MIKTISEIVTHLIQAYDRGEAINLTKLKTKIAAKNKLKKMPKIVDILAGLPENYKDKLNPILKGKPVRTASGVAVVAVMSKPHRCPHIAMTGNICVYCPGGPDSDFEYSTQSYTGYEPTSMRAIRARYNPYLQTRDRVEQLKRLGHDTDKVEFIVMGGTFLSLDQGYRDYFIRNLHDALSGHSSNSIEEAISYSEQSKSKCIGITIETRPDYCLKPHLNDMLQYGCTRIEIGVQSIYEDIARDTNRGHTVHAVTQCFQLAKDCGFKVIAHMMPDLPNMGLERDIEGFKEYFENPDFRTDGLKVYPTLVIRGTGLYELWKTGKYKNYDPTTLIDLVAKILALVPPWVRIYRVQRDIPMPIVTSGVEHGNLRELALKRMKDLNLPCRDVRTREVGIQEIHNKVTPENVELIRRDYYANGGWETFIAYEDPKQDILIGLLRLRKCSEGGTFKKELIGASIVRELHVYGSVVPIHSRDPNKFQHQGFGTMLMEEAERIAMEEHGSHKLAVISGVGTRHYYRKLGYELENTYMVKYLNEEDRVGPSHQNPFKPPIYQSLTSSHGPLYDNHRSNSILSSNGIKQTFQIDDKSQKENSSLASNLNSRKSCPMQILEGTQPLFKGAHSLLFNRQSSQGNNESSSRSSSKGNFKADRFIPFRGTQENFFEEFIMSNGDPLADGKKRGKSNQGGATENSGLIMSQSSQSSIQERNVQQSQHSVPNGNSQQSTQPINSQTTNDNSNYSSTSSDSSGTVQYSRGSGNKVKQTFQELITESMFTNNRGSPNTLSIKEAEEEDQLQSKICDNKPSLQQQRILSFKEKKEKPTMSLQKNLSLISSLVQEKTQNQQKSLRYIPQFPEKILDAPDLQDDYYLNLLDWSSSNILAVCLAQTVYLWNSDSGEIKQLYETENDADYITSVSWMKNTPSSNTPILAIGTYSKQIHLWDTNKFESVLTLSGQHEGRVSSLSWNPLHTSILTSGSQDSQIHNYDLRIGGSSNNIVCTFKAHRQEVCGLKWSPDGQQLASGGNDNLLCIWDINNRMRIGSNSSSLNSSTIYGPKYCFNDHKAAVKALSWCPWQRNLLASGGGSRDQCIKFWNTETGQMLNSVQTDSQVCALQWNPYDKEILSSHGFINNQLSIWKYPNMKKIADLRGHSSRVLHLALSPDGTTVASAAADETLRFWKVFQPTSSFGSTGSCGGLSSARPSTNFRSKDCDIMMTDSSKLLSGPFNLALR